MDPGFVDEARIEVAAGDGGHGSVSFRREKYRPKGPPDGGTGGAGGSVILRVDHNVSTLAEAARAPHLRAQKGGSGSGNTRQGAAAPDVVLAVPDGTVVHDEEGVAIADLVGDGAEFVAARGGRGGRGNAAFVTAKRRAPSFAERGERGERRRLRLELKVLADVGLVGFPNAGKSSLIARLSAARPKVAAYPFTTLTPNLGVADAGDRRFVIADVPGLIEGASQGKGLGLSFLRHLERCRALCFVLDLSAEPPRAALEALRAELRAHLASFDERVGVVAGNKVDLGDGAVADARSAAGAAGFTFVATSAVTGAGVEDLHDALARAVAEADARTPPRPSHRLIRLRPEGHEVLVEREEEAWRVRHARAERLLERFDVSHPDALVYVQEALVSIGVEEALARAGAKAGDEVRIGEVAFEFTPDDPDRSARSS
ncbi:MAG TPA: GTPase ObgE [Actinomycetota bacterium]